MPQKQPSFDLLLSTIVGRVTSRVDGRTALGWDGTVIDSMAKPNAPWAVHPHAIAGLRRFPRRELRSCSFWLVSALAIIGEDERARDLMERLLRVASPLGLFAEEFDVDTGRHLGNFPQAFSHLALIEAAARIIVRERLAEFS